MNRFEWNLKQSQPNVGEPQQILDSICIVATVFHRLFFSKKMHKLITKFVVYLATSYCHNSAMIIDHRKFMPNGPSTGYLVSTFNFHRLNQFKVFHLSSTLRIDRKSTPKVFQLWKLRTTTILPKFSATSNMRYCVLKTIVHTVFLQFSERCTEEKLQTDNN